MGNCLYIQSIGQTGAAIAIATANRPNATCVAFGRFVGAGCG
jgi:hypothetical protein